MGDDGVEALRRALGEPAGGHLDDEALAALATAEAAGEDVEALYPDAVAHVEACVPCAQAYGDLVELMLEAVGEMAAAAQKVSPQEVYAALLAQQLAEEGSRAARDVRLVAERTAAGLPPLFTELPAAPEEVTPALVAAALVAGDEDDGDVAGALVQRVTEVVREHFAALALYLQGAAEKAWGRALAVRAEVGGRSELADLQRGSAPAMLREPPAEYGAGEAAHGAAHGAAHKTEEERGRLPVTLRAVRLSTLACRLEVQVEAMEGAVGGAAVRVYLPGREEVAVTDDGGLATFAPVPIAALPHLLVKVEED